MKSGNYITIKHWSGRQHNWPQLCNNIYPIIKGGTMEEQQMEDRLWNYIDGLGDDAENSAIENLLATQLEWKNKYRELLEVHALMSHSELEEPSLRFTKNVMEQIARYQVAPATRNYINNHIIWGIGGFFVLMVLGFLVYGFGQINWSQGSSPGWMSQYHLDKKMDWSKMLNPTFTSVFLLINVVLGLVLLDMYLHRKNNTLPHKGI